MVADSDPQDTGRLTCEGTRAGRARIGGEPGDRQQDTACGGGVQLAQLA
ncbi:hypothetical protein [Candidatus Frankia alpina]|nr:hypothetical protein [Candidatus Frankia alpina]